MIYSLKGILIYKEQSIAVIECGGVGYSCKITQNTFLQLKNINEEQFLYTYMSVREDSIELFGFATQEELSCFKLLISVNGVGAKAGISILSELTPERLVLAVSSGDSKAISKSKGVGTKIAQRIVLELKDKIAKENIAITGESFSSGDMPTNTSNFEDALQGLMALGYSQSEILPIVKRLNGDLSTSDIIREVLKHMM
ncbi:MAG: Holliday junction branch migration protein RuvA [Ruminococcus sp.]|nr:Holliday junction branch migration protein RuvA [Ruminococcus sp.]